MLENKKKVWLIVGIYSIISLITYYLIYLSNKDVCGFKIKITCENFFDFFQSVQGGIIFLFIIYTILLLALFLFGIHHKYNNNNKEFHIHIIVLILLLLPTGIFAILAIILYVIYLLIDKYYKQ